MTTIAAKIYATPDGPAVSFRCQDGTRERAVNRRAADIGAAEWERPVTVRSYRELLELVMAAGDTLGSEDATLEEGRAADEEGRRLEREAAEDARLAAIEARAAAVTEGRGRP